MTVIWFPDNCGNPPCVIEVLPDGRLGDHLFKCSIHRQNTKDDVLRENQVKNRAVNTVAEHFKTDPATIPWFRDPVTNRIVVKLPDNATDADAQAIAQKLTDELVEIDYPGKRLKVAPKISQNLRV